MLNQELKELKEQIINHILSTFPEEKKHIAVEQINSMDEEQFIKFLEQNNLIKKTLSEKEEETQTPSSPFRMIVEEKIPSYKINENQEAIAVLEINPISKAHVLIIPKKSVKRVENIPQKAFSLAKKVSKKINSKYNPKEIIISSSVVLGEAIINVIPRYSNETINSERKTAKKEELEEITKELSVKKELKKLKNTKIKKIKTNEIRIPKRIP